MAKKLYVGNLPYSVNNDSLKELFSKTDDQALTVSSAQVITDRDTGRSKGFGFVEFENDAEAEVAMNFFNGREIEGRPLTVNEARPREERPQGGRSFGGNRGGNSYGNDNRF